MVIAVNTLTRYPVKGMSGQTLPRVELERGNGFPSDRLFGFARPNSGFNPENPRPLPKTKFYMLARDAALVKLRTEFDENSGTLAMSSPDNSGTFDISTMAGRASASQFLKTYLSLPEDETPELYEASPHRFTDVSVVSVSMMNAVSIINLDSVREFSKAIGQEVDPRRFRGNIHVSNMSPFSELDMVGQTLSIGTARLKLVERTTRCPATEVDLATGERNIKTPVKLREHYGHMDMGVYAEVVQGGVISEGDVVEVS